MPAQKPLYLDRVFCETIGRALTTCLRLAQALKRENSAASESSEYITATKRLNAERSSLAFDDSELNLFFGKLHLAVMNKSNTPAKQRAYAECALRVLTCNIVRQVHLDLGWAIIDWTRRYLREGIPDQWSLPGQSIMKIINANVDERNTLERRDNASLCVQIKQLESVPLHLFIAPASHTRTESLDPSDSTMEPPFASSFRRDSKGRNDHDEASGQDSQVPAPRVRLEASTSSASSLGWEFFDRQRTRHDRSPSLVSLDSDTSSIILEETNGVQHVASEESLDPRQEPNGCYRPHGPGNDEVHELPPVIHDDARVLEDFPGSPFRFQSTRRPEYRDPQSEDIVGREAPRIINQDAQQWSLIRAPFPGPIPPAYDEAFHTSPKFNQHDAQHSLDRDFRENFQPTGGDRQGAELVQMFLNYPFSVVKDLVGNRGISFVFLDTGVPWEVTDAVCAGTPGESTWFDVKEVHTKATLIPLLHRITPERLRKRALDLLHTRPMMLCPGAGRPKFEFRTLNPSQHYKVAGMNFQRGELSYIITCRCSTQDLSEYLRKSTRVLAVTE